jgi:hypothetical protein
MHVPSPGPPIIVNGTAHIVTRVMALPNAPVAPIATITRGPNLLHLIALKERVFDRWETLHRTHGILLLEALVDIAVQVGQGVGDLVLLGYPVV